MMMAHDHGGPPPAVVSAETRDALRRALDGYVASGGAPDGVREALHLLAAEGRERGIHAEQVLILLKDMWYALPALQTVRAVDHQSRMLQRLVTICIESYYGE